MERIEWVFGYGSLIWNPGFDPAEAVHAHLSGYARSFCLRSIQHRGTEDLPGLVLGLDPQDGASCYGVALRIRPRDHDRVLADLRARELVTDAYREAIVPVALQDGRQVQALAYVIDPDHVQYCGGLALAEQARIIAGASGGRGSNRDYLAATTAHLAALGIADPDLDWLDHEVRHLI